MQFLDLNQVAEARLMAPVRNLSAHCLSYKQVKSTVVFIEIQKRVIEMVRYIEIAHTEPKRVLLLALIFCKLLES